jgi:hypothetical protein
MPDSFSGRTDVVSSKPGQTEHTSSTWNILQGLLHVEVKTLVNQQLVTVYSKRDDNDKTKDLFCVRYLLHFEFTLLVVVEVCCGLF